MEGNEKFLLWKYAYFGTKMKWKLIYKPFLIFFQYTLRGQKDVAPRLWNLKTRAASCSSISQFILLLSCFLSPTITLGFSRDHHLVWLGFIYLCQNMVPCWSWASYVTSQKMGMLLIVVTLKEQRMHLTQTICANMVLTRICQWLRDSPFFCVFRIQLLVVEEKNSLKYSSFFYISW